MNLSVLDEVSLDRRRFIRDAAIVAWAAPTILTLSATRAGAVTCKPDKAACNACYDENDVPLDSAPCCENAVDPIAGPCCCAPDDPVDEEVDISCGGICAGLDAACGTPTYVPPDPFVRGSYSCYESGPIAGGTSAFKTKTKGYHKYRK